MKKLYIHPTAVVVALEIENQLLDASRVQTVDSGSADITYGGGSNQAARVKSNTVDWDDWE